MGRLAFEREVADVVDLCRPRDYPDVPFGVTRIGCSRRASRPGCPRDCRHSFCSRLSRFRSPERTAPAGGRWRCRVPPWPAGRAVALRHREARAGRVDARLDTDREHVLELELEQACSEVGVVAVGPIGEDRRQRDLPARRLLDQGSGERRLRLELDRGRDLRSRPAQLVGTSLLRQIQPPAERQRPPAARRRAPTPSPGSCRPYPTRPRPLPPHPRRVLAVLRDPRVVDDPGHVTGPRSSVQPL